MKIDLQIHGVLSSGQSCWKKTDYRYYQRFYSESNPDSSCLFVAELAKREDGGISSYYNYLIFKNVIAKSKREGSYFGMTVRIDDNVFSDAYLLFSILDNLFRKKILGTILSTNQNGIFQYQIDTFYEKQKELEQIETSFGNALTSTWAKTDIVPIKSLQTQETIQRINIFDTKGYSIADMVLKGIKVYMSPDYVSKQNSELQAKLKSTQENHKAQITEINKKNDLEKREIIDLSQKEKERIETKYKEDLKRSESEMNKAREEKYAVEKSMKDKVEEARKQAKQDSEKKINDLNDRLEEMKKEKKKLETKVEQTETELKNCKSKALDADLDKSIREIQAPLKKLVAQLGDRFPEAFGGNNPFGGGNRPPRPETGKTPRSKMMKWMPSIVSVICAVIIVLCTIISRPKPTEIDSNTIQGLTQLVKEYDKSLKTKAQEDTTDTTKKESTEEEGTNEQTK